MSAKAKTARAMKRKQEKRARKASERARYTAYKEAGQNSRSKRFKLKAKQGVKHFKHSETRCCNTGCAKCYPQFRRRPANQAA